MRPVTPPFTGLRATHTTTTAAVYAQKSLSLAAWKGQTVRVQFRATTDSISVH